MTSHKNFIIIFFLFLSVLNILAYHNAFHVDLRYDQEIIYSGAKIPHFMDRLKHAFFINENNGSVNGVQLWWFRPAAFLLSWQLFRFVDGHVYWVNLVNIGILTITGIIIFLTVLYLSKDRLLSGITSLLFCLHPVNGVWVNYIPGGIHCLLTLSIMLVGLLLFMIFLNEENRKGFYFLSLVMYGLALLFHEIAMFLPIYIAMSIYFLHKKDMQKAYRSLIPFGLILIVYIIVRFCFLGGKTTLGDRSNGFGIDLLSYVLTLSKVFVLFLWKLITLEGIVVNWCEPFIRSFSVFWAAVTVILLGILFYVMTRKDKNIVLWAIGLILVGFVPVCGGGIYFPKDGLLYEGHWLYFTAIGFFVVLAWALTVILRKWRVLGLGIMACVISFFMTMGWNYNALYADEIGYALYYRQYAPGFRVTNFFVYDAYIKQRKYDLARVALIDGLNGTSDDFDLYQQLAYLDLFLGQLDQAEHSLRKMQDLGPIEFKDLLLLGNIYEKKRDYPKAINTYEYVLRMYPSSQEAKLGLERVNQAQAE